MSAPTFSYSGMQLNYPVNQPLTISPVNTGTPPSPRLRIATVSGNSTSLEYPKDGLPNVSTYRYPNSVSARADGTLVVIDDSNTVRVISPSGVSSTLAGKFEVNSLGYLQTGYVDAQGSNAKFNTPCAAAFDAAGNIVVLDVYNYRIRLVSPTGMVSTLAGSGVAGYADGVGTSAQFKNLTALWIDGAGNIFVTDNYRVRKITSIGVVTTVAGGITKGNINGVGALASFKTMKGITGDGAGVLFVSDPENQSIRRIDQSGAVTNLIVGLQASGVVYYNSNIYAADFANHQIKVITLGGTSSVYAGSGVGQFKDGFDIRVGRTAAALYAPEGIAIDGSGPNMILYVVDDSMKVRKVDYANYSVTPPLPNGLTFDSNTGVISGIPTQPTPLTVYNIVAANNDGYTTVTIGFKIN